MTECKVRRKEASEELSCSYRCRGCVVSRVLERGYERVVRGAAGGAARRRRKILRGRSVGGGTWDRLVLPSCGVRRRVRLQLHRAIVHMSIVNKIRKETAKGRRPDPAKSKALFMRSTPISPPAAATTTPSANGNARSRHDRHTGRSAHHL